MPETAAATAAAAAAAAAAGVDAGVGVRKCSFFFADNNLAGPWR